MQLAALLLFVQSLNAQINSQSSLQNGKSESLRARTYFETNPLWPVDEWWHALVGLLAVGAIVAFAITMYRREHSSVPRSIWIALTGLRLAILVALIVFFLNIEQRTEKQVVQNSRVAILVDTSLSMGLRDEMTASDTNPTSSRLEQVKSLLVNSALLQNLQELHDLVLFEFNEDRQPTEIAVLPRSKTQDAEVTPSPSKLNDSQSSARRERIILWMVVPCLVLGVGLFVICGSLKLFDQLHASHSALLASGGILLLVTLAIIGFVDMRQSETTLLEKLRGRALPDKTDETRPASNPVSESGEEDLELLRTKEKSNESNSQSKVSQWITNLNPRGSETRLADALQYIINQERGNALTGIIAISDGQLNAGSNAGSASRLAQDANVSITCIAVGSDIPPQNVRIIDVKAPVRVFPGDKFVLTGLIQGFGLQDHALNVRLSSRLKTDTQDRMEGASIVKLNANGEAIPVSFELQNSQEEIREYRMQVDSPRSDMQLDDNEASISIEFAKRKTKVLLIAGGPGRDFQFLRNQLARDEDTSVDVLLQSATPGADQEGDRLLLEFPETREAWFEYDCIVAFDANWLKLSEEQVNWLEQWISQQAGGLIAIAGPVYTPLWTMRAPRGNRVADTMRRIYPVMFFSQTTGSIKLGRFGGEQAFPLAFTREGRGAEFLWLAPTSQENVDLWESSPGVFGYYAVSEAKPGAEIFARFSDPDTAIGKTLPIYLAGHFYGSGRVFFQASGEMWRNRQIGHGNVFETYYDKLIRWASQGRLSRESTRGVLLTEKQRCSLGDQVAVQAILRDARNQPLTLPSVTVSIIAPDQQPQILTLQRLQDGSEGTYLGQLVTNMAGKYRLSLAIPNDANATVLNAQVQATIPDLEIANPIRNDPLLSTLAEDTGGSLIQLNDLKQSGAREYARLLEKLPSRDRATFLPSQIGLTFARKQAYWLLALFTVACSLEWTLRRLHRLA
jgi:von Willebrand factor type A domain